MPVKAYGIFIAYPPKTDLRIHGLGRYLASFLKGAADRDDLKLVVACPSWLREDLRQLCMSEQVSMDRIEILSPDQPPVSLKIYFALQRRAARPKKTNFVLRILKSIRARHSDVRIRIERRLFSTRNAPWFGTLSALLFLLNFTVALARLGIIGVRSLIAMCQRAAHRILHMLAVATTGVRIQHGSSLRNLYRDTSVRALYGMVQSAEIDAIIAIIGRRKDIVAWYCPTAFWPDFNRIAAPRLMCVPDVALANAPVGFAEAGIGVERLKELEKAIAGADHLVAYSSHEKWKTLVEGYNCRPDSTHVVPHAANLLTDYVAVTGTADNRRATEILCREHLMRALLTADNPHIRGFQNANFDFLFYASQFRSNKNVISLLRAYEYLLRRKFTGLKLVLTGDAGGQPHIQRFIDEHDLARDVLFLHNLPLQQLAACYSLARVAVNPSLSEGGFPFTFTEALSVGTPVVMARIPVTEEVVTDPELQSLMLFNPHDWQDMAARIEWAIANRSLLMSAQKPLYDRLALRTWRHVVDEHIQIMDSIPRQIVSPVSGT